MRALLVTWSLAVVACAGAGAGTSRGSGPATHCPAPAGARLIQTSPLDPETTKPALTVRQWDKIPPADQPRVVRVVVREQPEAQLGWLAEVEGKLVIGISIAAYCGGAYPASGKVDVALPAFNGPIEIRTCTWSRGKCPNDLP